jgi:hypothetical protein
VDLELGLLQQVLLKLSISLLLVVAEVVLQEVEVVLVDLE